jgi:hypothetical protein
MPGSDGSDFRKFHMHYSNRRCGCNDLVCYLGWDSASSIGWPIALIHACCFSNPKTAIEWSRLQSTRTTSALSTYDDISSVGTTFKMVRRRSPNSASDKGKPRASVYQMLQTAPIPRVLLIVADVAVLISIDMGAHNVSLWAKPVRVCCQIRRTSLHDARPTASVEKRQWWQSDALWSGLNPPAGASIFDGAELVLG